MSDDDRIYTYDEEYYYRQEQAAIKASGAREVLDELTEWYFEFRGIPTVAEFTSKVRELREGLE